MKKIVVFFLLAFTLQTSQAQEAKFTPTLGLDHKQVMSACKDMLGGGDSAITRSTYGLVRIEKREFCADGYKITCLDSPSIPDIHVSGAGFFPRMTTGGFRKEVIEGLLKKPCGTK